MSTRLLMDDAQALVASAIQKQVSRCKECTVSSHGLRKTLARSLGVNRYQAYLLVNRIVVQLLENGVLEYWVSVCRGDVYKVNLTRLREIEMTTVPDMTASL